MAWKAIARSATGNSHQKQEMLCQDFGDKRILNNNVIVGAVSDGAGSAKHSEIGAQLAVETVLKELKGFGEHLEKEKRWWERFPPPLSRDQAKNLFTDRVNGVLVKLRERAQSDGYTIEDLACTLLIFIATPDWLVAMQIGDGFIAVRSQETEYKLLFQPDKGEFINETTFITSADALNEMQVEVLAGKQEFICASTDGLEKVAIRMSDWTPFSPFFEPLEEYLRETSNPEEEYEYLHNFLNSERLNARTDDDKTLLLCLFDRH